MYLLCISLVCSERICSGRIYVTEAYLGQHVHPYCVWEGLSPLPIGVIPCAAALESDVVDTGGGSHCDAANCSAVSLAGNGRNWWSHRLTSSFREMWGGVLPFEPFPSVLCLQSADGEQTGLVLYIGSSGKHLNSNVVRKCN